MRNRWQLACDMDLPRCSEISSSSSSRGCAPGRICLNRKPRGPAETKLRPGLSVKPKAESCLLT